MRGWVVNQITTLCPVAGKLANRLNARQSEMSEEFPLKTPFQQKPASNVSPFRIFKGFRQR